MLSAKKAQTAIELAVFGSVLIFMIGIIIRQSFTVGSQQNESLKALRLAMSMSYKSSEGLQGTCQVFRGEDCDHGDTSRNSASVTIVEDRLAANSGKYGPIDRIPYISSASVTNSRNLFMPVEPEEVWNLPYMDIFVNGQHFPLLVGNFKSADLGQFQADGLTPNPNVDWEPNCVNYQGNTLGCPKIYTILPNHPQIAGWCATCDDRFDLNRNGMVDSDEPAGDIRNRFAWQWEKKMAFDVNKGSAGTLIGGEGISVKEESHLSIDVDNDLKEETVFKIEASDGSGVIMRLLTIDFQQGDIDLTFNPLDCPGCPQPGLEQDLQMYTFLREPNQSEGGTYLQIDEGKLYGPGKQFVRTSSKKDTVDLIQRILVLSNDTGRFCRQGQPTPDGDGTNKSEWQSANGYPNPVEVCSTGAPGAGCFDTGNMDKTCMINSDSPAPGGTHVIFIRSRIEDRSGRKWITDESADRSINYQTQ